MNLSALLDAATLIFLDTAPVIYFVEKNPDFAEKAAELRARYNLSLLDAFQVAAAIAAGCDAFLTNDDALKRIPELNIVVLSELDAA
jgi:predicted nucleic acid-binding protein